MDAYVYIRIASGSMAEALAALGAKPGIKRVVATIGEWDLLLYAKGESLGEIGNRSELLHLEAEPQGHDVNLADIG